MKVTYDYLPPLVRREGATTRIFFGFLPVTIQMGEETIEKYEGYNVDMAECVDYNSIVSAIIRGEYPDDRKDAILFNRELVRDNPEHPKAAEYTAEYEQLQAWRATAKDVASEVLTQLMWS